MQKIEYLCPTSISILGVEFPIVVKVAPSQPSLLGLDAMYLSNMELDFLKREFVIAHMPLKDFQFKFLDMTSLLSRFKISSSDLVPIESLPPPQESYKELVNSGNSNLVVDLGGTNYCWRCNVKYYPYC